MADVTGYDIIRRALRLIGAIAAGEPITGAEQADALLSLNAWIDTQRTQHLSIWSVARELFDLTSGQQDYTLGTGGNFDRARPPWIDRASIISLTNPDQPLELPIPILSEQDWRDIPVKAVPSALPNAVYDNRGFPLRTLSFWPYPNVGNVQCALYLPVELSSFANATTDYTFPPGYEDAIVYNLAVRLAPEYGLTPDPTVVQAAKDYLANIKRQNIPLEVLRVDAALLYRQNGYWNWRTGDWQR